MSTLRPESVAEAVWFVKDQHYRSGAPVVRIPLTTQGRERICDELDAMVLRMNADAPVKYDRAQPIFVLGALLEVVQ